MKPIPIYPEINIEYSYNDEIFQEGGKPNFRLVIFLDTLVRKKSSGDFYYYIRVSDTGNWINKRVEEVISGVINRFNIGIYKVQLYQKYTEDVDSFDKPLFPVDKNTTTEEQRIKQLYQ